ncbi:unnamed protein product [Allacma fusca]|uniref:Small ribosomal subunit protein uS17 n=1 Tax=Allacma fusca TaxID=39272 RepID=A0A8J2P5D8_9HEXA|nr:unnamed protein product [Allacma fusca]
MLILGLGKCGAFAACFHHFIISISPKERLCHSYGTRKVQQPDNLLGFHQNLLKLAIMADQAERAFQKQPTVFLNRKKTVATRKKGGSSTSKNKIARYTRNVGLGFKPPSREAIDGTYIDKKCPFTGNVSIRGRILTGVVTKMKMQRTIIIRRDYLHYVTKYNRFEKRHRNMAVHLSPCFRDVSLGDIVTIGECRPLSKTVRFNTLKVSRGPGSKKSFNKF